jgi:hypothetical protein
MNERDTTLLNDYFNGLLSPSDAQLVRDRAAAEPGFGQEFSLREEMEAFPRRAEQRKQFTDTLVSVEKDFFQENSGEKTQPIASNEGQCQLGALAGSRSQCRHGGGGLLVF